MPQANKDHVVAISSAIYTSAIDLLRFRPFRETPDSSAAKFPLVAKWADFRRTGVQFGPIGTESCHFSNTKDLGLDALPEVLCVFLNINFRFWSRAQLSLRNLLYLPYTHIL
jgi:hypothetical protein